MTIKLTEEEEKEMDALKDTSATKEDWQRFLQYMAIVHRWSISMDAELQALRARSNTASTSEQLDMAVRSASKSMVRWGIQLHNLTKQTNSSTAESGKTTADTSKTTPSPSDDSPPGRTRRSLKR